MLRLYEKYTFDTAHIAGFNHARDGFAAAARAGTLPAVSFIEPDYIELPDGNDDHAPADMLHGQQLIAKIVKALVQGPRWEKTLFVVTYDEHGGFYDHVTPPEEYGVKQPDGTEIVRPIPRLAAQGQQLGPRVPAFVVSPYVEKNGAVGTNVSHIVFDHTSIAATILRRFCSPNVPRMSARADRANDMRWLLTRPADAPRPAAEFAGLIAELEGVLRQRPATVSGQPLPIPNRKPVFDRAFPNEHPERDDFGGFMAYASAITGRGS